MINSKNNRTTLNEEQRKAVSHINGPMMVVAGPGSGKTFLLIERIINLIDNGINAEHILVITFTKKAALEMEGRFVKRCGGNRYPVRFGTFHAVFFHILKFHGLYNRDSLIDEKNKYRLIEEVGIALGNPKCRQISWQQDMVGKITYYKNLGDRLYTEPSFLMDEMSIDEFEKVYEKYTSFCRRDQKLDFDDITLECLRLLSLSEDIREYWQNIFQYILVDEFQDINEAQYKILKLLGGCCGYDREKSGEKWNIGCKRNVFVVGDDDQSIYGFRGASPGIMNTFLNDFPECKKVFLQMNYRSCPEVVRSADILISNNKNRLARAMQKVPKDRSSGSVLTVLFENAVEECDFVLKEIKRNRFKKAAIIYRSEHCVGLLEEMIRIEGIPYNKKSEGMSFYDIEIVSVVISYIRIAVGKGERRDYLRIINHPDRRLSREAFNREGSDYIKLLTDYHSFLGRDFDDRINRLTRDLDRISGLTPVASLIYILKGVGLRNDYDRIYVPCRQYPYTLEEIINEMKQRFEGFSTNEELISHIDILEHSDKNENTVYSDDASITFITAHASKGLEYETVFIVGLQENLFPHHKYLNDEGIEEERRLFYVAMTRAKEKLYICGRGSKHGKRVSRFVYEIGMSPAIRE